MGKQTGMLRRVTSPAHRPGTIALVQTVIPDYRVRFFAELARRLGPRLELLSGDEDWSLDIRHRPDVPHVSVGNRYLAGRRLLWQRGVVRPAVAADVAVLGLNPRIASSWAVLVTRRLLRRRTLLWGHAWSRQGASSSTERLRRLMRRLADGLIAYTETDAALLRALHPSMPVWSAPNALYLRDELAVAEAVERPTEILCVGRLVASKQPFLLVEAFRRALPELPDDVRLVLVGDGPLRLELEREAAGSALAGRVALLGHVTDVGELRALHARAIATVAPGEVGLSLVQSLGFGVPMIVADGASHGPEFEAARPDENVVLFPAGSVDGLARVLVGVVADRDAWSARRGGIADAARADRSIEAMATAFVAALDPRVQGGT